MVGVVVAAAALLWFVGRSVLSMSYTLEKVCNSWSTWWTESNPIE